MNSEHMGGGQTQEATAQQLDGGLELDESWAAAKKRGSSL